MAKFDFIEEDINALAFEFAEFVKGNYLESDNIVEWTDNKSLNFVNERYEEFIHYSFSSNFIDEGERDYLLLYSDDTDAYIKEKAIDYLKKMAKGEE